MTVGELKLLLKMLPDDMTVHVDAPFACRQVGRIRRETKRLIQGAGVIPDRLASPSVRIQGGVLWYEPPADFKIEGRWRWSKLSTAERAALGVDEP